MSDETVSAREAIEKTLAHRIMSEPGFLEQLMLDPDGTTKPVIAELLADDGALDLAGVNVTVHLETEKNMHLVVPLRSDDPELSEVSGFAKPMGTIRDIRMMPPMLAKEKYTDASFCTASAVCPCTGAECSGDFKAAF